MSSQGEYVMSKKIKEELCETVMDTSEPDLQVNYIRKGLQRFNEDLGVYINEDQRYKLGRVLTIIDASISDPEQRKAIKDLVNNEWWTSSNRNSDGRMTNPHTDIRGLCLALGFELYPSTEEAIAVQESDYTDWAKQSYTRTILQE